MERAGAMTTFFVMTTHKDSLQSIYSKRKTSTKKTYITRNDNVNAWMYHTHRECSTLSRAALIFIPIRVLNS